MLERFSDSAQWMIFTEIVHTGSVDYRGLKGKRAFPLLTS
jgi:hypothetical protein